MPGSDCLCYRRHADVELLGRKGCIKGINLVRREVHDDVDIIGQARLAVGNGRGRTSHQVSDLESVAQIAHMAKQVSRFHGRTSGQSLG